MAKYGSLDEREQQSTPFPTSLTLNIFINIAARVLATYSIPGCVGRGVRLGSENSSGGAGGAGAGAGGVWAQVGGPKWVHRFGPLGIEVEKQGFRTAWLITGQKFP